jgi:hypothetical protein
VSVYVGLVLPSVISCKWPYKKAAHLVADTEEELMEFATQKLYLKARWFRSKSTPHFDVTSSKRLFAIKKGAIPFDSVYNEGKWLINGNHKNAAPG